MAFCAVCTATIAGAPYREPIGPDDALVDVCKRCATEEVVPKEIITAADMLEPGNTHAERAARIKAHRQALYDAGLCVNGKNHGPRMEGRRVCATCHEKWGG